jgi:hypothetical protein
MISYLLTGYDGYVEEWAELRKKLGAAAHSLQAQHTPGRATRHLIEYLNNIGIGRK